MRSIYSIFAALLILLQLAGCEVDNKLGIAAPDAIGLATAQLPEKSRRVAIVHSALSKENFYDQFAYNQLFAAVQHQSMMAGVPFDLLSEVDLASQADLLQYDAILIPSFTHVKTTDRPLIIERLVAAQAAGVGLIGANEFLSFAEDGSAFADYNGATTAVFGVQTTEYLNGVTASVKVANNTHPVNKSYQTDEELVGYDQIWFASFSAADGEQTEPLSLVDVDGVIYPGSQVIDRDARVVHFGNDQIMADHNQLWRVIQWVVYGDVAPVMLQASRSEHVFLARNDMDQAMIAAELDQTEIPLLDLIKDWKRDFNFVSSYYIDIGNDPSIGQYTDWDVSGPLYREYIGLGNEIATHSWTHPHYTSQLNAQELEFEFKDSAAEIGGQLDDPVVGAAVPGTSESLFVVETLNPWFEYLSGRSGQVGSGYQGAIGFLEPQHDMMYFSLNMSPDFELIDFLNKTPAQAEVIWKDQIDLLLTHANQPIIHWLWHDYGPTTQTANGRYTEEMFSKTIDYAYGLGAEFTTLDDMQNRIRNFASTTLSIGTGGVINAAVEGANVGQFSLKMAEGTTIQKVDGWYAYDDNRVFVPVNGGEFAIHTGEREYPVTRISKLPMRATLIDVTGDENSLSFTVEGEGAVEVSMSAGMVGNATVTGVSAFSEENGILTLQLDGNGTHSVSVTPINDINVAPVALASSVTASSSAATIVSLTSLDADGDAVSYEVTQEPQNGVLSGRAPNLLYTSNAGFTGTDQIEFVVNDGALQSEVALVDITVFATQVVNQPPFANGLALQSLVDQAQPFVLTGSDNELADLTYTITAQPLNGTLQGTAPNLVYTPNAGFIGRDSLQFAVSDGVNISESATVVFNVVAGLGGAGGTLANELSSVTLDGDLADWAGLVSFGVDPRDITGANNDIDWRKAWMAHDATHLYFAYNEYNASNIAWGNQIYLDTDTDSATGFKGFANQFALGADYVIEGEDVFKYNGTSQNTWAWTYVGSVEAVNNGINVEMKLPRTLLGDPQHVLLFFLGASAATGGDATDYFPDGVSDSGAVMKDRRFSYTLDPNVVPGNTNPLAFAQSITLTKNTAYPLELTGFDADGDALMYTIVTGPAQGTVAGVAPSLLYTPNANAAVDLIEYKVSDGVTDSVTQSIEFIMVDPPSINSPPAANNMAIEVQATMMLPITLSGSDIDGDLLTYQIVSSTTAGTLNGTAPVMSYNATADVGVDSFTYTVSDGTNVSAPATVFIEVTPYVPVNNSPVASSINLSTAYETATSVLLAGEDADGDTLTFTVVSAPQLGSLSGTAPSLTYLPFNNVAGVDTFSYKVNDGQVDSAVATVTVEVLEEVVPNTAPVALGQVLEATEGTAINIELAGSDTDQDPLTFSVASQPAGGVLSGTAPNLVYTPESGFTGVDSFTFSVSDGELQSAAVSVTIDVTAGPEVVVSNPNANITVDGVLADWNGLDSIGSDPAEIGGVLANNPLDWRGAWLAHNSNNLYFAYRNHNPFTLTWGHQIYIDVDGDVNTGFRGFSGEFPIGADYIIETDDVQKYTGTGSDWSWQTTASANVVVQGDTAEFSIARNALGAATQELRIYMHANNVAFGGEAVDHFPDAAQDSTAAAEDRYLVYSLAP